MKLHFFKEPLKNRNIVSLKQIFGRKQEEMWNQMEIILQHYFYITYYVSVIKSIIFRLWAAIFTVIDKTHKECEY